MNLRLNKLAKELSSLIDNFKEYIASKSGPEATEVKALTTSFDYLLNDPTTPELKRNIVPPAVTKDLPISVIGFTSSPGTTGEIMAAQVFTALQHTKGYAQSVISKYRSKLNKWAASSSLRIHPAAGEDFNAYYDRKALKFFYAVDSTDTNEVYTAQSVDIVAHECGHAILDALRPDLWSAVAPEIWAFHEAFGDCMAILTSMQYDEVLQYALDETGGDLTKSNIVSRSAEELGKAIYNMYDGASYGSLNNALRDASIDFTYVKPNTLPKNGLDNQLTNEPHSFSRVFTSAFWNLIVKMYQRNVSNGNTNLQSMKIARDAAALYLFKGASLAPKNTNFFAGVANAMLVTDRAKGSPYREDLAAVFNTQRILLRQIKMLNASNMTRDRIALAKDDEYYKHSEGAAACLHKPLHIKLKDHLNKDHLHAMCCKDLDLTDVEIEIPNDQFYEFNLQGVAENEILQDKDEAVESAVSALQILAATEQVGPRKMWKVENGRLVRHHIRCGCCRI